VALVSVLCLNATAGLAQDGGVTLQLEAPSHLRAGQPLTLRFEVTNAGSVGLTFKRPWKWASNGMRVVAIGADGSVRESSTFLVDIAANYRCSYFKQLQPGHDFSFEETLRGDGLGPSLPLPPGRYKLRWVYDAKHYPDEKQCELVGLPIWKGRGESPEIEVTVE